MGKRRAGTGKRKGRKRKERLKGRTGRGKPKNNKKREEARKEQGEAIVEESIDGDKVNTLYIYIGEVQGRMARSGG